MLHKRNFLLILLSGCLLASTAQAQVMKNAAKGLRQIRRGARTVVTHVNTRIPKLRIKPPVSVRPISTVSARVTKPNLRVAQKTLRTLNARVERTFQQAVHVQEMSNYRPILEGPTIRRKGVTKISLLSAKRMYPNKPFLQHPVLGSRLAEAYFLAQSNRFFIKHMRELEAFWPKFNEAIPRFYEEAEALKQPADLLEWTAEQIPATTKDLFIGEIHGQHEIPQFLSELLPRLRQKNPNREIILFTEFLVDNQYSSLHFANLFSQYPKKHYYYPVWEKARELNIPLVGLESSSVQTIYPVKMVDATGKIAHVPAGATPEGMRLRNEHWRKIMQKYRQQHPDALFVVYTGSAHSFYKYPFSLAKKTPKETTFMLELTMEKFREDGKTYFKTDNLEALNGNLSFPQTVLKWNSPDLVELSGFDARIKLPNTVKSKALLEQDMAPYQDFSTFPDRAFFVPDM